jgi:hypothetical protein
MIKVNNLKEEISAKEVLSSSKLCKTSKVTRLIKASLLKSQEGFVEALVEKLDV